ncbi:MAG: FeoB-associated Cys-rich membrane protein [Oscillospiraceae bacterium]|nr:FeoB-associated Cys-rich membrane protein [Oscillospiraceae bacterium]
MGSILVIAVIAFLVFLCIRNLVLEHKRGELCECIGDCSKCKIQCHSNPNYYGMAKKVGNNK